LAEITAPVIVTLPALPVVTVARVFELKVAVTEVFPVIVSEQVAALPLHAPPQVVKT
jgi:hypothetical protein